MILQNYWHTTLLGSKGEVCKSLADSIKSEVVIVGGGIAGLHAALQLSLAGRKVILLEKTICGGGSTGKSAGFLTPDSELEISQLERRFGREIALALWNFADAGIKNIVTNIKKYKLDCDLVEQDSLFLGLGNGGKKATEEEVETRHRLGFSSEKYGSDLKKINTGKYSSGVRYKNTFGINPLRYCQELKRVLIEKGVVVFENSEVTKINKTSVETRYGKVAGDSVIICADKLKVEQHSWSKKIFSAQTFLSISEPLANEDIKKIFPQDRMMCWDSRLVYTYYRLTGDNRLLLGGGSEITTFMPFDTTIPNVINGVISDFKHRFSNFDDLRFSYYWPGRIDTSKDLLPIVDCQENLHLVLGCVGLPWAASCGELVADRVLGKKDIFKLIFSAERKFVIPFDFTLPILKMVTFPLNNIWAKYVQKN